MTDAKMDAALSVAKLLKEFEEAADRAVSAGAELAAALPRARVAASLPAQTGQQALARVGEAVSAAIDMRSHAVAAHKLLNVVRGGIGLPEIAFGDEDPKIRPKAALAQQDMTTTRVG